MQGFSSVPFKTESAHGFATVNGVTKFSSAGIVLEFEAKLFGLITHGVKEVRLSTSDILDIKFRKGLFKHGAKIEVRTRTIAKLVELPNKDGKLILKLVRDDFERGKTAVEQLQKDLESREESLQPPQTPVSQLFGDQSEDETIELKRDQA